MGAWGRRGARQLHGRPSHPHIPHFSSRPRADDHTRVILSLLHEEGHSDYINGNFIRVRPGAGEEGISGR